MQKALARIMLLTIYKMFKALKWVLTNSKYEVWTPIFGDLDSSKQNYIVGLFSENGFKTPIFKILVRTLICLKNEAPEF